MQTVQLTCRKCGKVMAISTEHLGTQVHCPHCMEIVQAPPPPGSEPTEIKGPDAREGDDIFAPTSDEDIFGGSPKALVEMPEPPPPPPRVQSPDEEFTAPSRPESPPHEPLADSTSGESQLPRPKVQAPQRSNSMFVPMLLIFLIPYSIVCTVYIAWNLIHPPKSGYDPLEMLPDSIPKDGGPKRVEPTVPLPKKLKTSLKNPLQIGDLKVIPLKVRYHNDNLELHLKMVNISKDVLFNPIPLAFVTYVENKKNSLRPYTFLDSGKAKVFGGYLEWWQVSKGKKREKPGGFSIGPGEEMLAVLITYDKDQDRIKGVIKSSDSFLWRVHVRRGFVAVKKKSLPATAVVGVEFTAAEIEMDNEAENSDLRKTNVGFACRWPYFSYYGY